MKNYFKIATLAGLVLASMLVTTSCSIKKGAVKTFDKFVEHGPYDVAIVPGIPYDPDKVNVLFKARMLWAKSLYDRGIVRNIIFSGAAVHSPYTEAVAMKLIAEEMGIAPEHIYIETQALHSNENIEYGKKMAAQLGFKKVAVASDPFQLLFLKPYLTGNGTPMAQLPLNLDSMKTYINNGVALPAINTEQAFVSNFVPLKDRK